MSTHQHSHSERLIRFVTIAFAVVFATLSSTPARASIAAPHSALRLATYDQLGRALYAAADRGDLRSLEYLLDQGADPNFRNPVAVYAPVLLRAISSGHAEATALLIARGAQGDAFDGRRTPILVAAASLVGDEPRAERIIDAIEVLLEKGHPNVNASDAAYVGDDRSALHVAAASGSRRLITLLLRYGADARKLNRHDESPLFFAAQHGHAEIAYDLIQAGARVEQRSRHTHESPLMLAAQNGHARVVKLLVYFNADLRARNTFGKTSLDLAREAWEKASSPDRRESCARTVRLVQKALGRALAQI